MGVSHPPEVWFGERAEEMTLRSETYDVVLTLLHFTDRSAGSVLEDEAAEDVFDRLMP